MVSTYILYQIKRKICQKKWLMDRHLSQNMWFWAPKIGPCQDWNLPPTSTHCSITCIHVIILGCPFKTTIPSPIEWNYVLDTDYQTVVPTLTFFNDLHTCQNSGPHIQSYCRLLVVADVQLFSSTSSSPCINNKQNTRYVHQQPDRHSAGCLRQRTAQWQDCSMTGC